MPKKLKVFHGLENYGTQAGLLASGLRKHGIDAISVVNFDPFKRKTDVELLPILKWYQKFYAHPYNYVRKLYWFFRYNTFHFYFGKTFLPKQLDLPFYKIFGKKVLMEYLGNDVRNYKWLVHRYNLPDTHDYYRRMNEHDSKTQKRINFEKKYLDYKISCLPTHVVYAEQFGLKIDEVLPLSLNVDEIEYSPLSKDEISEGPLKILHASLNRARKGTNIIIDAVNQLKNDGYEIDFRLIENVSHEKLFEEYKKCHIFISQIGFGWFGTSALEAMAVGRPTCAFIDERYFECIDYSHEIPVVNVGKDNITEQLRKLILNKENLPSLGQKSREFVEKYHNVSNITEKLLSIYNHKLWNAE